MTKIAVRGAEGFRAAKFDETSGVSISRDGRRPGPAIAGQRDSRLTQLPRSGRASN
jgi:hypothetical protein